jgi:MFS family permease
MEKKFRFYNILVGWLVFIVAAITYLLTIEPTASLWDCGEFIASSFKLQVGHPPGAPLFMIVARFFSLLAGADHSKAAMMVNAMSGLASAFAILFLFWSISHLAKKIVIKNEEYTVGGILTIIGSALVGSLAYTFSDTFWFSAVEGEVYASSALFTSVVFWAMLKWENVANEKYANRWIILIAYLMGLSIGVHLLNLLTIPALVLIFYFKKYEVSKWGIFKAVTIGIILLGAIFFVVLPGILVVASWFELLFVNTFGMPYNSGVFIYLALLIAFIFWGIKYTIRKKMVVLNTVIIVFTVLTMGYSSFIMLVIRAQADPPMDENSPDNIFALISYINREQYGSRPLLYGQYFNAPIDYNAMREEGNNGKITYTQLNGRYEITNRQQEPIYDSRFMTFFPRMSSSDPEHVKAYKDWANIKGEPMRVKDDNGQTKTLYKPTFIENIKFFVTYQIGYMYFRYFMWNFVGRMNDTQGTGGILNGQWVSGIKPIDSIFFGNQDKLPDHMKNNPSRATYFFLPLILGLIGLFFQIDKDSKNFWVVLFFFILTGVAIVVYLNQPPIEPRERDYAFAGSFYAFAIWIGLGVTAIASSLQKKKKSILLTALVIVLCLVCVPVLMAKQNWKAHDRSGRYTTRDLAADYLNSCAPNAILFTVGDNDTFPLWYCQEVEGIRTDVRVVNLMLLNTDWYIDQTKRKAYDSDPVPFSLTKDQYIQGKRNYIYLLEKTRDYENVKSVVDFVASDNPDTKHIQNVQEAFDFIPTKKFMLAVDSSVVLSNGTVSRKDANQIVSPILWTIGRNAIGKSELLTLDLLAHNNWKRPIYFDAAGNEGTLGLDPYLQLEGFAWRLVPIKTTGRNYLNYGRINSDILYENLMNKFKWGRMNEKDVHIDHYTGRNIEIIRIRNVFNRLAEQLINEGKKDSALKVLDRCISLMPNNKIHYDMFSLESINLYYTIGQTEKANALAEDFTKITNDELVYFLSMQPRHRSALDYEISLSLQLLESLTTITKQFNQTELSNRIEEKFNNASINYNGGKR